MITLVNTESVIPSDGKERLVVNTETGETYYRSSSGNKQTLTGNVSFTAFQVYVNSDPVPAGTNVPELVPDTYSPIPSDQLIYSLAGVAPYTQSVVVEVTEDNIATLKGWELLYAKTASGTFSAKVITDSHLGGFVRPRGRGFVTNTIPAGMTEKFVVRTSVPHAECDVKVDWGDGAVSKICSGEFEAVANGYEYLMTHTYQTPGVYTVTIYGKDYWGLWHYLNYHGYTSADSGNYNRMCRCLSYDLPLANCVSNLASFATRGLCLIQVDIPAGHGATRTVVNMAGMLRVSRNLLSVSGLRLCSAVEAFNNLMDNCSNVEYADFVIPATSPTVGGVYAACPKLHIDINSVFPAGGFLTRNISATQLFVNCGRVYGTVPDRLLYNDPYISWTNTENTFKGCSGLDLQSIPKSWGGKSEATPVTLVDRVAALEGKVNG